MNTNIDEMLILLGKKELQIFQLEQELRAKDLEISNIHARLSELEPKDKK